MATLHLRLAPLRRNLDRATAFCQQRNLTLLPVTKIFRSRSDLLDRIAHPSLQRLADVHVANLVALDPVRVRERVQLRPRFGDLLETVKHATRVFLSDPLLARRLGEARVAAGGAPLKVTLMLEGGDLRDGITWADLPAVVRQVASVPGLDLEGLGVNLGCLAGAIPGPCLLERWAEQLRDLRRVTGHSLPQFSLGGTVFWDVLRDRPVPPEFTEFRLGEAVYFGWNTSLGKAVDGFETDVFALDLEVLECWEKHVRSTPEGPGFNAFGVATVQSLTGNRRRAVLDGGENLAPFRALTARDSGVVLVGETHEYTVVDCQSAAGVVPGAALRFRPGYEAVARCFLSPYLDVQIGEDA